jgi:hypothetical protein
MKLHKINKENEKRINTENIIEKPKLPDIV